MFSGGHYLVSQKCMAINIHPPIKQSPPIGATAPSNLRLVKLSTYSEPEKNKVPIIKDQEEYVRYLEGLLKEINPTNNKARA